MFNEQVRLDEKLEESRTVATAARVSEDAGQQQLARMMDEQPAQIKTIETLLRCSSLVACESRPPSNFSTPFVPPFLTPSTGLRR